MCLKLYEYSLILASCYGYIYIYIYNTSSYATIITHFIRVAICIIRVHKQLL